MDALLRTLVILSLASTAAATEHWPQFRGASLNYEHQSDALPVAWAEDNGVKWKVPMDGRGWASPVVWGYQIFLATAIQEVEGKDTAPPAEYRTERVGKDSIYRWELHCLDLEKGKNLWKTVAHRGNPGVRTHPQNTYASETPVTDGKRVYVYFGMVGLFCFDFDGELVWKKTFGDYRMDGDWGTSSSPLLYNDTLFLQTDNEVKSFLVALDTASGEERWQVERPTGSSWSSPIIWENSVRTELVTNANDVRGYDPATGNLLWSLDYPGGRASSSPTGNAEVLLVGNEARRDGGGVLYAVKPGASGNITPKTGESSSAYVLWSTDEISADFASPLIFGDHAYIFARNRGAAAALDLKTGQRMAGLERLPMARPFWSSPWAYDGKVFCIDERGTTFVVQGKGQFELLSTHALEDKVRSSPAIVGNQLLIRSEQYLYCIQP